MGIYSCSFKNVECELVYFWIWVEMNKGDGLLFVFSNLKL